MLVLSWRNYTTLISSKFYPINIKEGIFKIGSKNKMNFSYDNEKPLNHIKLDNFLVFKVPRELGVRVYIYITENMNI